MTATDGMPTVEVLPDDWEPYAAWMRRVKDAKVADADMSVPGDDDLTPRVEFYRDGRLIAAAMCRDVNRDEGLQAAWIGVSGFRADAVNFIVETHMSGAAFHEKYGRTPDPHELQHLCDDEGACELGLITDMLVCLRQERSGRTVQVGLPYHVNKSKKEVHWQPEVSYFDTDADETARAEGVVIGALRESFERPTLEEEEQKAPPEMRAEMAKLRDEMGPDLAALHMDMAVMRIMATAGYGMMYTGARTDEEAEIVRQSAERAGLAYATHESDFVQSEKHEPDALDAMGLLLRAKMEDDRRRIRDDELAETARRRAARGEPVPAWAQPKKKPTASKRYTPPKAG